MDPTLPNEDSILPSEESSLMSEDPTTPREICTLPCEDSILLIPSEDPTLPFEDMTLPSEDPTLQSEGMMLLSEDPTFLSEKYTATTDSSEKSSIIAPSISPLHSYSCGSPSPSPSPFPTLSFESEEAATACVSLDEVDPVINSHAGHAGDEKPWCGIKLVADNVDFNITPSFQRVNKVKQSMHYVHTYGVKDRVDLSSLSDESPQNRNYDANDLLPSTEDITSLKEDFCTLLSR